MSTVQIDTDQLEGEALDWAVAKLESEASPPGMSSAQVLLYRSIATKAFCYPKDRIQYSSDWPHAGPIIEREDITVLCARGEYQPAKSGTQQAYSKFWVAEKGKLSPSEIYGSQGDDFGTCFQVDPDNMTGPTALVAAMRCYVASKFGPKVEVPEELIAHQPKAPAKGPSI